VLLSLPPQDKKSPVFIVGTGEVAALEQFVMKP